MLKVCIALSEIMERCDLSVVGSNLHTSSFSDGLAILATFRNRGRAPQSVVLIFIDNLVSTVHQVVAPRLLNFMSRSRKAPHHISNYSVPLEFIIFIVGLPMLGFLVHLFKHHFPNSRLILQGRFKWLSIVTMTTALVTEIVCNHEAIGAQKSETLAFGMAMFSSTLVVAIVTTTLIKALVVPSASGPPRAMGQMKNCSSHGEQFTYSSFLEGFASVLAFLSSSSTIWTNRILSSYLKDDLDVQLALALPSLCTICSLLTTMSALLTAAIISRRSRRPIDMRTLSPPSTSNDFPSARRQALRSTREDCQFDYCSLSLSSTGRTVSRSASTIRVRSNVVEVLKNWWQRLTGKDKQNDGQDKGADNLGFFEAFDELKVESNQSDEL